MHQELVTEVIEIIRSVAGKSHDSITCDTKLLVETDLDSLKLLELVEAIRARYGVDLSSDPYSVRDLRTPEAIAATIVKTRQ